MAIRTRGRVIARRGRPRRRLEWARQQQGSAGVAAGATLTVDLLSTFQTALGAQLIGATVQRTVIRFAATSVGTNVITNSTCGLIKEDVLYLGNPVQQPNADWLWYAGLDSYEPGAAAGTAAYQGNWDIRSKRRLDALDETVLLVVRNASGFVLNVSFTASVLLALP